MAVVLLTLSFFSVVQSCLTLCDSMDYSSPGSSAHGFLQARILEWVVIPFSRRFSLLRDWTRVSCIVSRLFTIWTTCYFAPVCKVLSVISNSATLWTIARQTPLPTGFSRQEYWSGLPYPTPGDLPNPGIEPTSPLSLALAGRFFTTSAIWKAHILCQLSSVVQSCNSLRPLALQHTKLPCPTPSPGACSNSCPSSQWYHPNISSSVVPFSSRLQSFPASGSFQMSQFFTSGSQSIRYSASVLPMNIQDWFPLGWTGWISLQFKGLSRVFSNTIVQKY